MRKIRDLGRYRKEFLGSTLLLLLSTLLLWGLPTAFFTSYRSALVDSFISQNALELKAADTFAITNKLNQLSASEAVLCLEARLDDKVFFERRKTRNCDSGWLREVILSHDSVGISLRWVLTLPLSMKIILSLLLIGLFVLAILTWVLGRARERARVQAKEEFISEMSHMLELRNLQGQETESKGHLVELREQLHSLIDLRDSLVAQRAVLDLARRVSHDIRSPLGALEVVAKDMGSLSSSKAQLVKLSISRIREIANDLLAQTKANNTASGDAKSMHPHHVEHRENFLIKSVVLDTMKLKEAEFKSKFPGVELKWNVEELLSEELEARGTAAQFSRVLSNILNNAAEAVAAKGEGKVCLAASELQESVELRVEDTGAGIPSDLKDFLGKKEVSYGKSEGNGIGVLAAKQTLESWGGDLLFEARQGGGTIAVIRLSRYPGEFLD